MALLIAFLHFAIPDAISVSPAAADPKVERCLPENAGFLSMRLRGSIQSDVDWRAPVLDCTGMARPDGRGLRLRFAGPLAGGGELAIVFAAPGLGMGVSARGVPVNVTLLDATGERIYGTQGENRCVFDEVEQTALDDRSLPPQSYRVTARGFCTVPATAVDGDGSVLLTRFDLSGLVSYSEEDAAPVPFAGLPRADIQLVTATGRHDFKVWIAATEQSRERGLMHVKALPAGHGMLFLFGQPRIASFWMKDTYLSLDIVFIDQDGIVVNVARDTKPLSLAPIQSVAPVTGVLELIAGSAARISLSAGDRVLHPAFNNQRAGH